MNKQNDFHGCVCVCVSSVKIRSKVVQDFPLALDKATEGMEKSTFAARSKDKGNMHEHAVTFMFFTSA